MKMREPGRTGIQVSPYHLGTMMFGRVADIDQTDLVRSGKICMIGFFDAPVSEIVEARWVADRRNLQRFRTGQSPYSIVNRGIECEVLPTCERYGRPIAGVESAGDGPAHRPLPQRSARGAERADEPGAPAPDRRARCGMSR
ncbi:MULTISPECIES: aldo-keto reductase family protein [unclassified Streptosporangium]|uniref:hypothetical protein n=1 Tax=Streptosporangium sp. NPDC005286 TaxID=3154463 RepID=UPI0033AE0ADE